MLWMVLAFFVHYVSLLLLGYDMGVISEAMILLMNSTSLLSVWQGS